MLRRGKSKGTLRTCRNMLLDESIPRKVPWDLTAPAHFGCKRTCQALRYYWIMQSRAICHSTICAPRKGGLLCRDSIGSFSCALVCPRYFESSSFVTGLVYLSRDFISKLSQTRLNHLQHSSTCPTCPTRPSFFNKYLSLKSNVFPPKQYSNNVDKDL